MRASDADRHLVEDVLNNAYVDGRLTKAEQDERQGMVWQAKTFNDLAPLTSDLIAGTPTSQYTSPDAGDGHELVVETSGASPETEHISVVLGETRRHENWRVHANTSVKVILGEATLDLRHAVLEDTHLTFNLTVVLGELKVIVPDGVRVRSQLSTILGEERHGGLGKQDAGVTLTLSGTVLLGEVNVLGPQHTSLKSRILGRR